MGDLVFLTGPVRSGKSRRAVEIAGAWGDAVVFVASYRADPADAEMAERVAAIRPSGRCPGARWRRRRTWRRRSPGLTRRPSGVVLDSIVLWAAARFGHDDAAVLQDWSALLTALRASPWPSVVVGDEIGWSPVPMEASLRRFRDLAGWLGQRTAGAATEAWLMVAGCPVRLK